MTRRAHPGWGFLTNHAHVLIALARDHRRPLHEVASEIGLTTRGTQAIVADLIATGHVRRTRVGRSNHYDTNAPWNRDTINTRTNDDLARLSCAVASSGSGVAVTRRGPRPRAPQCHEAAVGPSPSRTPRPSDPDRENRGPRPRLPSPRASPSHDQQLTITAPGSLRSRPAG